MVRLILKILLATSETKKFGIFITVLFKIRYHPNSKANCIARFTFIMNSTATGFRTVLSDFCFFRFTILAEVVSAFQGNTVFMALADMNLFFFLFFTGW